MTHFAVCATEVRFSRFSIAPNNGLPTPSLIKATIPGTNYCGPGGSGTPTTRVDGACAAHDLCYQNAGAKWYNNVFGTGGAAAAPVLIAQNNAPPVPNANKSVIERENVQFNQCTKSGTIGIMATLTPGAEGAVDASEGMMDLQKSCLLQNPLAALSQKYSGMFKPGASFVVGYFSSWF
jgi:hypothetical protein